MNLLGRNRYAALLGMLLPVVLACNASTHVPTGSRQMIYSAVVAPTVHPRAVALLPSTATVTPTIPIVIPSATPTWEATATTTPSPSFVVERGISEETRDTITLRLTTVTRY